MELIDVYDENNNYLGYNLDRKEVHEKKLWHRHVSAWVMNYEGKVLLQQRALNKDKNPGKWAKTGGHVDSGETEKEAIKREVEEEIGLKVKEDEIKNIEIFKNNDEHYFTYGYIFFTNKKEEEFIIQKEELNTVKYYSIDELEEIRKQDNKDYTFCNWDEESFNRQIKLLKENRNILMLDSIKSNYNLDIISIIKNDDSTDGNVYNIETTNNKYIVKIYDDLNKATNMINIHNFLCDMYIPRVIQTKDKKYYLEYNGKYIVMYSFLEGIQVSKYIKENDNTYTSDIIISIAKEIRKLHDLTLNNTFNLDTIEFANNLKRKSLLHFDLTKENIFINDRIGFIDFDDAKYGDSVCDIAILLSFLFISKKRGIDNKNIKLFLDNYYNEDEIDLKKEELSYIKQYMNDWTNHVLNGHEFDSSLKDSFLFKKNSINDIEI